MNKTSIEYLDFTWNPLAMRCTPVSEGCAHCWHLAMANRLAGNPALSDEVRAAYAGKRPPLLVQSRLEEPLGRKKPARIGVQLMGDLFHKDVPTHYIAAVWNIMQQCPQHVFLILTKRPSPMLSILLDWNIVLPNVWLLVSVENQDATWRIGELLQTPAAVRGVSAEPLLEAVDLRNIVIQYSNDGNHDMLDALNGMAWFKRTCIDDPHLAQSDDGISWVIVGPETGPGARGLAEFEPRARNLRDQCVEAGVAFFLKKNTNGTRQIDGRQWNEMPEGAA